MTKRKVSSSRTRIVRGPLGGIHATTSTYEHTPRVGPSRTSRALAASGVKPWQPKRAAITGAVLVWLVIAGQNATAAWVLAGIAVVVAAVWAVVRRLGSDPEPVVPKQVPPGPAWCDHCADWTVHPTEQHAA